MITNVTNCETRYDEGDEDDDDTRQRHRAVTGTGCGSSSVYDVYDEDAYDERAGCQRILPIPPPTASIWTSSISLNLSMITASTAEESPESSTSWWYKVSEDESDEERQDRRDDRERSRTEMKEKRKNKVVAPSSKKSNKPQPSLHKLSTMEDRRRRAKMPKQPLNRRNNPSSVGTNSMGRTSSRRRTQEDTCSKRTKDTMTSTARKTSASDQNSQLDFCCDHARWMLHIATMERMRICGAGESSSRADVGVSAANLCHTKDEGEDREDGENDETDLGDGVGRDDKDNDDGTDAVDILEDLQKTPPSRRRSGTHHTATSRGSSPRKSKKSNAVASAPTKLSPRKPRSSKGSRHIRPPEPPTPATSVTGKSTITTHDGTGLSWSSSFPPPPALPPRAPSRARSTNGGSRSTPQQRAMPEVQLIWEVEKPGTTPTEINTSQRQRTAEKKKPTRPVSPMRVITPEPRRLSEQAQPQTPSRKPQEVQIIWDLD